MADRPSGREESEGERLDRNLSELLQELDARVELEKQTPKEAAAAYLKEAGYIE